MLIRSSFISAVALAAALSIGFAPSVEALTMKECSAKYQAAKTAGTLGGQKWNDFRKTQCGTDAAARPSDTSHDNACGPAGSAGDVNTPW